MAAAVNKRTSDSKYVTLLADSRPDVDITFTSPILDRSTSDYMVGVDNMTVCSTALSMIEPIDATNHTEILRVVRKPIAVTNPDAAVGNQTAVANSGIPIYAGSTANLREGNVTLEENLINGVLYNGVTGIKVGLTEAYISSGDVINSVGHLMDRLRGVASVVNTAMHGGLAAVDATLAGYTPAADAPTEAEITHLEFRLSRSGKLVIEGTKAFWSMCAIEVPTVRNQFGLFSATKKNLDAPFYRFTGRRFLTVDALTGLPSWSNMVTMREEANTVADGVGNVDAIRLTHIQAFTNEVNTGRVLGVQNVYHADGTITVLQGAPPAVDNTFLSGAHAAAKLKVSVQLDQNVFLGMDRRVAVELGTSLPIKQSPIVDHQKQFPDFVIGRWIYRSDNQYLVNDKGGASSYSTNAEATREYQGPRDRVVYHQLMPQNKVQTLRVKLFARVRDFNADTEVYTIRTISLPTDAVDWWHARLHFVSKD